MQATHSISAKKVENGPKTFCNQIMLINILLVAPHPLTKYRLALKNIVHNDNCVNFMQVVELLLGFAKFWVF